MDVQSTFIYIVLACLLILSTTFVSLIDNGTDDVKLSIQRDLHGKLCTYCLYTSNFLCINLVAIKLVTLKTFKHLHETVTPNEFMHITFKA